MSPYMQSFWNMYDMLKEKVDRLAGKIDFVQEQSLKNVFLVWQKLPSPSFGGAGGQKVYFWYTPESRPMEFFTGVISKLVKICILLPNGLYSNFNFKLKRYRYALRVQKMCIKEVSFVSMLFLSKVGEGGQRER